MQQHFSPAYWQPEQQGCMCTYDSGLHIQPSPSLDLSHPFPPAYLDQEGVDVSQQGQLAQLATAEVHVPCVVGWVPGQRPGRLQLLTIQLRGHQTHTCRGCVQHLLRLAAARTDMHMHQHEAPCTALQALVRLGIPLAHMPAPARMRATQEP